MKGVSPIGMPGSGKSTVGKALAKSLRWQFLDADDIVAEWYGCPIGQLLKDVGKERFIQWEGDITRRIPLVDTVCSTGGSIVLHKKAMEYLRTESTVVYIRAKIDDLTERLTKDLTLDQRGIVGFNEVEDVEGIREQLAEILEQRSGLYESACDLRIDSTNDSKGTVQRIIDELVGVRNELRGLLKRK